MIFYEFRQKFLLKNTVIFIYFSLQISCIIEVFYINSIMTSNQKFYIPLYYTEKIKRPNQNYLLINILLKDFPIFWIAFSFLSPHPLVNAFSIIILSLSFWCIYEIGYYENDLIGEKYELKPTLSEEYQKYKNKIDFGFYPWLYSLGFGILGIISLELSKIDKVFNSISNITNSLNDNFLIQCLVHLGFWSLFLIIVRLLFSFYNHVNVSIRIAIYPLLQITRNFGFTLITTTNFTGAILLASLVIARWIPYLVYRYNGDRSNISGHLIHLFIFSFLILSLIISNKDLSIFNPIMQIIIAFIFLLIRSGQNILTFNKNILQKTNNIYLDNW